MTSKNTKSKCRTCGEKILDTGNYRIRILRGKRIPKKLQKLIDTGLIDDPNRLSSLSQTKFGQFLLKRVKLYNQVEITCGKCSGSSKVKTFKPVRQLPHGTNNSLSLNSPKNQNIKELKKRRNKSKDVDAGLLIPGLSSPITDQSDDKQQTPINYLFQSGPIPGSSSSNINKTKQAISNTKITPSSKDKDIDALRKALCKSKKRTSTNPPRKGTSLKDFLSSM